MKTPTLSIPINSLSWVAFILLVMSCIASPASVFAQFGDEGDGEEPILIPQEDLDELLMWYVDEKYEKVLFKAIRYTEDDEENKHPLPYLFMAKAYLGIHFSSEPSLRESYEVDKLKALKNALKYGSKFVKKDKEQEFVQLEDEFFEQLRKETVAAAESEMESDKYTKAKSYYKYLTMIDEEDPGALMMMGATYYLANAARDAQTWWDSAEILIRDQRGRGLSESQQKLLSYAMVFMLETFHDKGDSTAIRQWTELGDIVLSGDRQYEAVKRSIGG
ncbi:MAG: hypothetical protein O3B70_04990 [Bacteroidetes bacterium]|nr:hypothetical protein [Bacteroidota bacterium]MDA0903673.1 hypothetical protein [Bacteroidota bacterium]MDA1242573.1 hypothetical protein [Bacteroidota bacterium]